MAYRIKVGGPKPKKPPSRIKVGQPPLFKIPASKPKSPSGGGGLSARPVLRPGGPKPKPRPVLRPGGPKPKPKSSVRKLPSSNLTPRASRKVK